jgi:hypothetical protein
MRVVRLTEVDQGQHDAVRDVFVAPGGVTLFRKDLLTTLKGYDERYVALGDDLEISWRAHLLGSRVVCAPSAVIAHAERLGSGFAALPAPAGETQQLSRERLYRRNELRSLWLYWGTAARIWTLLLLALFNVAEIVVAVFGTDIERAINIRESWHHLHGDLDGRGTVAGVKSVPQVVLGQGRELFRQLHHGRVGEACQHDVFNAAHLLLNGRIDAGVGVAKEVGPPRTDAVHVSAALDVVKPDPFAPMDGQRRHRLVVLHLGAGVPNAQAAALAPVGRESWG